MVSAILRQEILLGGRRNRLHALRWVYGGWLVCAVSWIFLVFVFEETGVAFRRAFMGSRVAHASAPEVVGARFVDWFLDQQTFLLLLVTPAMVGGALVDEKRQGTLQYLLLTEVEPRHLVLGKMLGRLLQVFLIGLAGLPLFALLAGFGGVAPISLPFIAASVLLPIIGVSALTLFVSVFCRQTRDAVLAVYLILLGGWVLLNVFGGIWMHFHPLWVLAPARGPEGGLDIQLALRRLTGSAIAWGMVTAVSLALAAALLRRLYLKTLENSRKPARWFRTDAAPVDEHPIRWRELNFEGLSPLPMFRRVPRWVGISLVALTSTCTSLLVLATSLRGGTTVSDLVASLLQLNIRKVTELLPDASGGFLLQSVVVLLLASLVVGIRSAGAVVMEKENGSWEALLLTPLSAKQIVYGKVGAIMGSTYAYLLAYAGPALCLAVLGGFLSLVYTLIWLAVTVLAMYFIGATGIRCSVYSKTSWGSLLKTLSLGYVGGLLVSALVSPAFFILALVILILLLFVDVLLGTSLARIFAMGGGQFMKTLWLGAAIGLAILFFVLARWFLARAHRRVADVERVRYWDDEPMYRPSRRSEPIVRPYR